MKPRGHRLLKPMGGGKPLLSLIEKGGVPIPCPLGENLLALESAVRAADPEALVELSAALARLQALASGRLSLATAGATAATSEPPESLWTAAEVARFLRISRSEVYRRSEGDLGPARVSLGPGGVRFDPSKLRAIVLARTGGAGESGG